MRTQNQTVRVLNNVKLVTFLYWTSLGLLAYMPFHLFLSRWLSLYTGGLGAWDAGKDILTLSALALAVFIFLKNKLYKNKYLLTFFVLSAVYVALHLLFYAVNYQDLDQRSFMVGTLYNGRIFAYLFIGMIVVRTYPKLNPRTLLKVILVASTLTCMVAFVQYIAPKDLMTHFGYSIERGVKPAFFIDDKPDFPRVMSTIRDPNSYGAYLVLPITLLWIIFLKLKKHRTSAAALGVIHAFALLLTFSRGAWLGTIIALSVATFFIFERSILDILKKRAWIIGLVIIALIPIVSMVKNQYVFQNVILHSDKSTVLKDPNELRIEVQTKAIDDIADQPEGHGPGTAGLVSIGNPKGTVLTENYFLQIGYELGIAGLLIFVGLLVVTYKYLLQGKRNITSIAVISSFWGYIFIATLIHLWSNEAVAAQWWLLAGLLIVNRSNSNNRVTKG